jgi:hypothetical protein
MLIHVNIKPEAVYIAASNIIISYILVLPIAVAVQSKAQTVFARSNTEIVGSNPT